MIVWNRGGDEFSNIKGKGKEYEGRSCCCLCCEREKGFFFNQDPFPISLNPEKP